MRTSAGKKWSLAATSPSRTSATARGSASSGRTSLRNSSGGSTRSTSSWSWLASVTERTHEIGIRKSLGARRRDILWQFVIEAGVMASVGGLIGVILALVVSELIQLVFTASVPLSAVIVGVTVSTGVGLFFGIYPA